ncbi:MAG: phosphatidylserine decarboxylase [Candidatus Delongbacteria bacterium]|nr:phosphatidylserine decarboxylase [Candidatus Delongbacteria bacterium]
MARDALPLLVWMIIVDCLLLLGWLLTGWGWTGGLALLGILLIAGVGYFFRDPPRQAPPGSGLILSGADGRVLHIREEYEPEFFRETVTAVAVFMSPLDVHINRMPVSGQVRDVIHRPGRHGAAFSRKADTANEHTLLFVEGEQISVLVKQIAGAVARRIVVDVQPGATLQAGERFGMIKFGSRVDLFFPRQVEVLVQPGDRVIAGESIIGEIS